jgi:hypothetical protein
MNTPSWMIPEKGGRTPGPREPGLRKPGRKFKLETVLGAVVVLAWGWGVYELTLLFLK